MRCNRHYPTVCKALLAGLLAQLFGVALKANPPPTPPLTIMPFQTATFVRETEVAAELNEFAEFAARERKSVV